MNYSSISLNKPAVTLKNYNSIKNSYRGETLDKPIALAFIIALSPVYLINILIALVSSNNIFCYTHKSDALGRNTTIRHFTFGLLKNSATLIDVVKGSIGLCGVPMTHSISLDKQFCLLNQIRVKPGVFSLYDLHLKTGLTQSAPERLLEKQLNGNVADYLKLLIKSLFCALLYCKKTQHKNAQKINLFGLTIDNMSMKEAVNWVSNEKQAKQKTQVGFFINVNSINLAISDKAFHQQLTGADVLFVDGSGMRVAANKAGFLLNSNNNGTDMLPHLCKQCIENNHSIYMFGAKPNIAKEAAHKLATQFPLLRIAGTEHGYTQLSDEEIIANINNSKCDVLLVGMGSPIQEQWLLKHQDKLQCKTALAVGGLFDFYSGRISRSPMWLRELGMEWVWRLLQEPKTKFNRYVIGTPLFLYRTFILGLASKEIK